MVHHLRFEDSQGGCLRVNENVGHDSTRKACIFLGCVQLSSFGVQKQGFKSTLLRFYWNPLLF